eukprot:Skav203530  [mRNA]  locus=scaffold687:448061:457669:- [translate_table: standard]
MASKDSNGLPEDLSTSDKIKYFQKLLKTQAEEASRLPENRNLHERFKEKKPQRIDSSWRDKLPSPEGYEVKSWCEVMPNAEASSSRSIPSNEANNVQEENEKEELCVAEAFLEAMPSDSLPLPEARNGTSHSLGKLLKWKAPNRASPTLRISLLKAMSQAARHGDITVCGRHLDDSFLRSFVSEVGACRDHLLRFSTGAVF